MARMVQSPFGRALRLGSVAHVEICAHWSLLPIVVLVSALVAAVELPLLHPGAPDWQYWTVGLCTALLFFVSLVLHEVAHAVVARRRGLTVTRTTLWLLGGLTEITTEPPTPRTEALVGGAGPATSAVLGAAAAVGARLVGSGTLFGSALAWIAAVNILLALFNSLPAAPLDGGRLLHAAVWASTGDRARATAVATGGGQLVGAAMIGLGLLSLMAGGAGGAWLALLGWYLLLSARREAGGGPAVPPDLTAADVMDPAPVVAPSWWSCAQFLAELDPQHAGQAAFPLVDVDGAAVGGVTPSDLERTVRLARTDRPLTEARRGPRMAVVAGSAPLTEVLPALQRSPHVVVVAGDAGRPVGVIEYATLARVARGLRLRAANRPRTQEPQPASFGGRPGSSPAP